MQHPSTCSIIGKTIAYARQRCGFTRRELACKIDVDYDFLAKVERGEKNISNEKLDSIFTALGLSPYEFFAMATEENLSSKSNIFS